MFNALFDGGTTEVPLIGEGLAEGIGSGSDSGGVDKSSYYACNAGGAGGASAFWPLGIAVGGLLVGRRRRARLDRR